MIVRVLIGLFGFAVVAVVRGQRRRARRDKAMRAATMTVRSSYAGPENLLYRVTIERGGPAAGATFTWSRDGERGVREASALQPGAWISLENDIDVRFDGTAFAPGDFWTFPARFAADTVTTKGRRRGAKPSARGRATRRR